jgi:hypothetical protein
MDDQSSLDAIEYLGKKLQKEDCYFATEKQISEWWRYRDNLRNKKNIDRNLYEIYRPVELMVDQQGKLRRKELEYNAMAVITSSE